MQNLNTEFYAFYRDYILSLNCESSLEQALIYSFDSNGKLFRPNLFWSMAKDLGITKHYFEIAVAIEMIHTYSLVHDDLPAMDNDDYRRGKLTCHKMFGEDIAILTGDALLTHAFELIANVDLEPASIVKLIKVFTKAAGASGMIDGQVMDVKNENDPNLSLETLKIIHDKKTAMMIELPIICAQIVAQQENSETLIAARSLGLFYQIQDDYLDTYGDFEKMGKATNADSDKVTYSTLYTKKQLEVVIEELSKQILTAYEDYSNTKKLVETIVKREG